MPDNNSDSSGEQYFYPKHCTKYNNRNFGKKCYSGFVTLLHRHYDQKLP
jgi:hypothetical protein